MSSVATWIEASDLRHRLDADFYRPEYIAIDHMMAEHGIGTQSLEQMTSLVTDGTHKTPSYVENGVPFLSAKNIQGGFVVADSGYKSVSREEFAELKRWNCAPEPNDVLVAKSGSIGSAGLARGAYAEFAVFESVAIVRPASVRPAFLSVFLNSHLGQLQIRRHTKGAVIRHLHLEDLREVDVPLPDPKIQMYIARKVDLAERCRSRAKQMQGALHEDLSRLYVGCPSLESLGRSTVVAVSELDTDRLDAWHYQRQYIELVGWLRDSPDFSKVGELARLSRDRWSPKKHSDSHFKYIEISNVDTWTGQVSWSEVPVVKAPSRARRLVRSQDVLVSTVRPNRNAVGLVPTVLDRVVATTGFSVVRAKNTDDAYFLSLVLRHPVSTAQLMRWNTGSAYPAIEEGVPLEVLIPGADTAVRAALGNRERTRQRLLERAVSLIGEAGADVERLIVGTLDTKAIIAGTLSPPTEEDVLAT